MLWLHSLLYRLFVLDALAHFGSNAAQKQVLMRTHQLELQHAEETKAREVQSRLNTASASVQQTLTNLQASNASLQTANTQLEHQLRERKEEINALSAKLAAQGSGISSAALEQKAAEVAALKKELAASKQTCDETLALAEALQQTMDMLLQNGQAQEETIATLQGRLRKAELDREELRVAQEADAQRVRQAVAEATAAGEQPTTLEELQEQKIIQLLAQIAALEMLLRERTETISKLSEQQFELAHELEKSKKVQLTLLILCLLFCFLLVAVQTSGKYWSEQQATSSSAEALHAQHKALLKELNDIRAALRADQRRAVLIPDIIDRLDAIVSRDSALMSASPTPSPVASAPAPSVSVAPTLSPPAPTSQPRQVPTETYKLNGHGHAHDSDEDAHHDHHGHSHQDGHTHAHGPAHSSKAHNKTHSAPQVAKPQKRGFREWIFGSRRSADPLPAAPTNTSPKHISTVNSVAAPSAPLARPVS